MALYHMHSDVLGGFYQSDVFVYAHSTPDAIDRARKAYETWLKNDGFMKVVDQDHWVVLPDEPGFKIALETQILRFVKELETKLKVVTENAMIMYSI